MKAFIYAVLFFAFDLAALHAFLIQGDSHMGTLIGLTMLMLGLTAVLVELLLSMRPRKRMYRL